MLKPNDLETLKRWDNQNFVHPWEGMSAIGQNDRTFVEGGSGIYVVNENGERLIDGPGGMWCVQIGYGRAEMADAMAEQARQLAYFSPFNTTNSVTARLAHEIAARTPGDLNHVFFTTGGSTAVDSALRFVQFRNNLLGKPEKKIIISRHKAYHGSTYLAASVSGKERDRLWLDKADELVHFLPDVNPLHRADGSSISAFLEEKIQDLESAIQTLGSNKVAALKNIEIFEAEGILDHVKEMTPLFLERLGALSDMPFVTDTRGMGLMGCVECSGEGKTSLERDYEFGSLIDAHCQSQGLILRPIINMCVFSPPLIISEPQINQMFDILESGIKAAGNALSTAAL